MTTESMLGFRTKNRTNSLDKHLRRLSHMFCNRKNLYFQQSTTYLNQTAQFQTRRRDHVCKSHFQTFIFNKLLYFLAIQMQSPMKKNWLNADICAAKIYFTFFLIKKKSLWMVLITTRHCISQTQNKTKTWNRVASKKNQTLCCIIFIIV